MLQTTVFAIDSGVASIHCVPLLSLGARDNDSYRA